MIETGFEESGKTEWTTKPQEWDFYDALTPTDRVHVQSLGPATQYLEALQVPLVTVDLPDTPANAPTILFVGLQHGNEPAGREAILSTIRDLAKTTKPDLVELLRRCRFHFMPTANPNGFPQYRTVPGGGGRQMNREHASLAVVESQYVQQTITDLDPILVVDCHEHYSPSAGRDRIEFLPGGHPAGDHIIDGFSDDLLFSIQSLFDHKNIDHGLYSPASERIQVLRGMSSIRRCAFLLVETPAREGAVPKQIRL